MEEDVLIESLSRALWSCAPLDFRLEKINAGHREEAMHDDLSFFSRLALLND